METVFHSIKEKKFINRGFLSGFFCPIYGFGAVLTLQFSKWISDVFGNAHFSIVINILLAVIVVTVLEYITGFFLESIFDYKWWDYSDNALNLNGYICIKYSFLWGVLAFILVKLVHPVVSEVAFSVSYSAREYLMLFLLIYFVVDTSYSIVDALDLRKIILNYPNIPKSFFYKRIIRYKRFFLAFPQLIALYSSVINQDIRSMLNDKIDKIKIEVKNKLF